MAHEVLEENTVTPLWVYHAERGPCCLECSVGRRVESHATTRKVPASERTSEESGGWVSEAYTVRKALVQIFFCASEQMSREVDDGVTERASDQVSQKASERVE